VQERVFPISIYERFRLRGVSQKIAPNLSLVKYGINLLDNAIKEQSTCSEIKTVVLYFL